MLPYVKLEVFADFNSTYQNVIFIFLTNFAVLYLGLDILYMLNGDMKFVHQLSAILGAILRAILGAIPLSYIHLYTCMCNHWVI